MKKYLQILLVLVCTKATAQIPDDALRTAWHTNNGTARNIAIGGVMGSLGGDLSAAQINPAGLAFYRTNEFALSPAFLLQNNRLAYRGTDSFNKKNIFNYGTSGFVISSQKTNNKKWLNNAFALTVSQLASFNNNIQFKGFNNVSSFSEQFVEELVNDNADTTAALGNYIFGSSLAFRTYLIDTLSGPGGVLRGYQSLVPINTGVQQTYSSSNRGGIHEVNIAFASNYSDKWYLGVGLNVPIIRFQKDLYFKESDATNNPNNNFSFMEYKETLISNGVGVGLKLGAIYKPATYWRLGFTFHTPQFISFKDRIRSEMTTNTEAYAGTITETSDALNSGNPGYRDYTLTTPWRAIASASYVFREVSNTKKQRAFLSADIEYVHYKGARFSKSDEEGNTIDGYYDALNQATKNYLRGNFNIKLGGEIKFDPIMFRAGIGYYGSPYQNKDIDANRFTLSAGIGYRNKGMFIDIAVVQQTLQDAQFAYRLIDKPNTYAQQRTILTNIVATLGFKF
ncbi:MAG: OmpP1/FadL family transporter [Chitinophagaceae bacterium]